MRNPKHSGFPPRSQLANSFIQRLNSNSVDHFLIALLKTSLELTESIKKSNINDLENEFRKRQPWFNNDVDYDCDNKNTSFFNEVIATERSINPQNIDKELTQLKQKLNEHFELLTVAIDEAHTITNEYSNKKSLFQVLRCSIRKLFKGFNIVFILTTTDASIPDLCLTDSQITASQRDYLPSKDYLPFCQLVFCDALKSTQYENDLMSAFINKRIFTFISKLDLLRTIYCYGRPLWSSLSEAFLEVTKNTYFEVFNLAKVKLIMANNWQDKFLDKPNASLAILASCTNILNTVVVINQNLISNLIARYMATLFNTNENCSVLSFRYVSEPILAEAACHFMSDDKILGEILDCFSVMISKSELISTGLMGELVTEILLLKAHNLAALENKSIKNFLFSRPITVAQFMQSLIGESNFEDKFKHNLKPRTLNAILAFNHFIEKLDVLKQNDLLKDFIGRCAAGRFKFGFPKYDFFVPIIFEDNEIGCILIQVKNKRDITLNGLKTIAKNLDVKHIFSYDRSSDLYTDIKYKEDNFISIIISLGNDLNQVVFENKHFIISGIESFDLDETIKCRLSLILNFSRNNSNEYEDKDIQRIVTFGCTRDDFFTKKS